jgi:hypothetical protein
MMQETYINIEVPSPSLHYKYKWHEAEQLQNVHKDTAAHNMNILFLRQEYALDLKYADR